VDAKQGLEIRPFASQHDWEEWLEANHATSRGLWLKIAKKGSGVESVSYPEALESALCYGWIDGQKAPLDVCFWLQRFTPRGRKSRWSQINRDKATELMSRGRLRPAGLARIEEARADGRWDAAYPPQSGLTVPEDLQRELDRNPAAQAAFATLDRLNRYAILYRLLNARKPETRARRLAQFVAMLNEQKTIYT
jgi:uncharacterized protein YdeI (YjbR/CyaY-like superfamily)